MNRPKEAAVTLKPAKVRTGSGKKVQQYPAKLSFHGTDKESDLNAEE